MSPLGRLVGLAFVLPVEIGTRMIETVPVVVGHLPAAADRVRREIMLARFIGKLAVDHGIEELRERLNTDATTAAEPARAPGEPDTADPASNSAAADTDRPLPDTLALADYEHLSSAQVVAKLDGLDRSERDTIERYEQAGRHRRTILGKLDQLRSEP